MSEQQTTTTVLDEDFTPAPSRTVHDINRDLRSFGDRLTEIETPLMTPRHRLAGAIMTSDDETYIAAARAEFMPALEEAERQVIAHFDEEIARLQEDERLLSGSGFRHNLSSAERDQLPPALTIARSQMETLPADELQNVVQSAVVHNDRPLLAAFVSLAGIVDARKLTGTHRLKATLDQARVAVMDDHARFTVTQIRETIQKARDRRAAIVDAANQEQPGSAGSYLERYQFGRAGTRRTHTVDHGALMRRAGR
jgi:hypothetical protein